jgi:hypothetical protein
VRGFCAVKPSPKNRSASCLAKPDKTYFKGESNMTHSDYLTIIFIAIGFVIPGLVLLLDDSKIHGK